MDAQTKRYLTATVLCLVAIWGWMKFQQWKYPHLLDRPTAQLAVTDEPIAEAPTTTAPPDRALQDSAPQRDRSVSSDTPGGLVAVRADSTDTVVLGDDREDNAASGFVNSYEMGVIASPIGASVESIKLSRHRNLVAKDRKAPDHDPYDLLAAVKDPGDGRNYRSFVTEQVRIRSGDRKDYDVVELAGLVWSLDDKSAEGETVKVFRTRIRKVGEDGEEDTDLLELTKIYRLAEGSQHLEISLAAKNLLGRPCDVILTERGSVGMTKEDPRYDYRRVVAALIDDAGLMQLGQTKTRDDVFRQDPEDRTLVAGEGFHTRWTAVTNKYFSCIVVPLPEDRENGRPTRAYPAYLSKVAGMFCVEDKEARDDLTLRYTFKWPRPLGPGEQRTVKLQVFCGPKSEALFEANEEAVERQYALIRDADARWCTFAFITAFMQWLLIRTHAIVGNYGVAIIFLVIIVRLLLHPVSKRGQIHMMKMQKNQQRIKPKIEALQQQYKNDKQKLNEETMKLYREEGVNPAGMVFGCLPMLLQMPIWVALWTTLNTNVDMRHMPFFGYIRDLSSPDALVAFAQPFNIPLLGAIMGPVTSFNLLPILMAGIMYGQQKLTQRLTRPDKPVEPKLDEHGRPIPDQMAQQQKMMNFMMIFMGLIFYNFPSGLCLYILSSSLLGMAEQYYIRKHIRDLDQRGGFEKKKEGPGKPGFFARKIGELQKRAEVARLAQASAPRSKPKKRRKKPRF